ncbi:hypothetical protein EPO56_03755 [Patescibacteria group bacterium]|nr:MAG: hypothetical protein EPO56_03755 [Patescibacteria group bacterium]
MNQYKKVFFGITAFLLFPLVVFAATARTLQDVLRNIGDVITVATPIVVTLGLLGFFWGLAMYIFSSGVEEKRKKGVSTMIWGIVALFVMFSVFGIINLFQNSLGVSTGTIQAPRIGN